MSNPNNLIRPSMLGANPPAAPPAPPSANNQISPDLANMIKSMISLAIEASVPNIVQSVLNNTTNPIITDQTIDAQFQNNMSEMDKIPDVVRSLREFSGNASEFSSWKKSVERILRIYEPSKGTPRYFGILNVIRNKIIGKADIALESYNTPLDWTAISRCLTTHYADKRDICTLEYQMTCLIQGRMSINEFYQKVYGHLSLLLNKIGCMEIGEEAVHLLTENYRAKALDTFVRGLSGDLPRLLGIKEPKSLPEALHLCLKLENQNFRAYHANNQMSNSRQQSFNSPNPRQQHFTVKYPQPQSYQQLQPQSRFYPELAHLPQPISNPIPQNYHQQNLNPPNYQLYANQNPNQVNRYQPQNPFNQQHHAPPRPPKPPQPMDVDESVRTRAVNYMNRPKAQEMGKRPPNTSMINHPPIKVQRNFHINTDGATDSQHYHNQHYHDQYYQDQYYEDLNDHNQNTTFNNEKEEPQDLSDVHFLD
ncbi:retrovirus-related Gag polyprotein from transposon HMS-Beagle isoform X1 [Eurosta solidaginis]|uniref:retrovirus-related Gag polyprotein from transposon HMS-Beagle isoform X1 n=1 Tax=Eurosta solidaginis TaxID=178769 RepID=UPI00353087F9